MSQMPLALRTSYDTDISWAFVAHAMFEVQDRHHCSIIRLIGEIKTAGVTALGR
jgi:hypothetical protein